MVLPSRIARESATIPTTSPLRTKRIALELATAPTFRTTRLSGPVAMVFATVARSRVAMAFVTVARLPIAPGLAMVPLSLIATGHAEELLLGIAMEFVVVPQ